MGDSEGRLWNPGFTLLLLVNIVNFTGFGIITPQIPRFAISLGATLAIAGPITAVFSFSALVGRPFASIMGDRLNKKYLLIAAFVLNGLFTTAHILVPSLFWLIPIRVLHGLVFSVSSTLAIALSVDYVPKTRMGEGIGIIGLGNIIGMAIGPNIGIILVERFSFQFGFAVSGLIIIAAGLTVLILKYKRGEYEKKEEKEQRSFSLSNVLAVELLPNVGFVAIFMLGNGLINSFMVMLGYERGIANVGYYFFVNAAVAILTRHAIGKIIDRKGVSFAILPGYIFGAMGMVLIGFASMLWHLILAAVFFSIAIGCGLSAIQTDCIRRLPPSRRTVATGTYFIGLDIGMVAGPMLGGIISDFFGFHVTFYSAGILMLIGFTIYGIYMKRTSKGPKVSV